METAFLIMLTVCISVIASVGVVYAMEVQKKNGVIEEEERVNGGNGQNGELEEIEKLATRIIARERNLDGNL